MKFGCMTCTAKYDIPDERVRRAGGDGLRIRCTRCRAIMVVSESTRMPMAPVLELRGDDEPTKNALPRVTASPSLDPAVSAPPAAVAPASAQPEPQQPFPSPDTSVEQQAALLPSMPDMAGVPAALSASGVFRPIPGVHRQVTGFFFPELEELRGEARQLQSSRLWYAAIQNRPRGPFAASEMIELAEKGKIRDATLVWRPGLSSWRKVRQGGEAGTAEDLSWLRKPVLARKLREIEARERAQQAGTIPAVQLTRTSVGGAQPSWSGGGTGLPPPLPELAEPELPPASVFAQVEGPAPPAWSMTSDAWPRAARIEAASPASLAMSSGSMSSGGRVDGAALEGGSPSAQPAPRPTGGQRVLVAVAVVCLMVAIGISIVLVRGAQGSGDSLRAGIAPASTESAPPEATSAVAPSVAPSVTPLSAVPTEAALPPPDAR